MSNSTNEKSSNSLIKTLDWALIIRKNKWLIGVASIALFSFILYMISLSRYPISYGPDGPYYDLQVRYILRTGFPESNDAPLIYYYLVPFVILAYLGIKIGMALITSMMAFPVFFLTETFSKKIGVESKIPSLLSSFLITVNIFCFRMIEDFMQNLAGVFFILWFIYFAIHWFENLHEWKKYGILTFVFLLCSFFSHVYTAGIILILAFGLLIFHLVLKSIKTRSLPVFELKLFGIMIVLGTIIITLLIFLYPTTLSNFTNRFTSYLDSLLSISLDHKNPFTKSYLVFVTIPYLIGILALSYYLYIGVKKREKNQSHIIISKIFILVIIPSNWQIRFLLLAFLPIALIVPLGLKYIELIISKRSSINFKSRQIIIGIIAFSFALSSLIQVVIFIPRMGPAITMEQYDELEDIKTNYIPSIVNDTGVIFVSGYTFGYWVEFLLDMECITGNLSSQALNYIGRPIYGIFKILRVPVPFNPHLIHPWNPFLPYRITSQNEISLDGINSQQDPPPSPPGLLIYGGIFLELRLLFNWNGTKA
jgi:hypothetical protein